MERGNPDHLPWNQADFHLHYVNRNTTASADTEILQAKGNLPKYQVRVT